VANFDYKAIQRPANYHARATFTASEEFSKLLMGVTKPQQLRRVAKNIVSRALEGELPWVKLFLGLLPNDKAAAAAREAYEAEKKIRVNQRKIRRLQRQMEESKAA